MKFFIAILLLVGSIANAQDFNERKMDTVMFNIMNSYRNQVFNDYIVWSPVVQSKIMSTNYEYMKTRTQMDIHSLHNPQWANKIDLPDELKSEIIEENINPLFLRGQIFSYGDDNKEAYGTFDYMEIIVSIPIENCQTYQDIANHAIHAWNRSDQHSGIMNANYKKKVIVGTTTFYCQKTKRVFISFVFIS